ncbi:MAG: FKBP-type peptidyl-prolyl cis-trans isomerase [Prevotella sp.]|jgi:FKBP-type peptidyl-prolyl cis-trans isomerase FklB
MNKSAFDILKGMVRLLPFYLLPFMLFTSCSESSDEVEEFADWENFNQKKWNSIFSQAQERVSAGDTSWKIIRSWNYEDAHPAENTSNIVVHVLNEGTGTGCPLYTDSVLVHYTGRLMESPSYPDGYQFDSSMGSSTSTETAVPAQFLVSSLTDGFATAVQNMHIGDEWEVYIPWTLGYGSVGTTMIPAYSVLVFTIKLQAYYRAGEPVPDFKAKAGYFQQEE